MQEAFKSAVLYRGSRSDRLPTTNRRAACSTPLPAPVSYPHHRFPVAGLRRWTSPHLRTLLLISLSLPLPGASGKGSPPRPRSPDKGCSAEAGRRSPAPARALPATSHAAVFLQRISFKPNQRRCGKSADARTLVPIRCQNEGTAQRLQTASTAEREMRRRTYRLASRSKVQGRGRISNVAFRAARDAKLVDEALSATHWNETGEAAGKVACDRGKVARESVGHWMKAHCRADDGIAPASPTDPSPPQQDCEC